MSFIKDAIRGFFMSIANSVPGVSGGTVAFILGFYNKLINSINNLFYGEKKEKIASLKYLLKLLCGWIIGMILSIIVLSKLFEDNIYEVSSLFLGFIVFSLPSVLKNESKTLSKNLKEIWILLLGIIIVVLVSVLNPIKVVNITEFNLLKYLYVFICSSVAICAMILPGISGSSILLVCGIYIPIINSVKELLNFNMSALPVLLVFVLGSIVGLLSFIKLIKKALTKYRSKTIYFILGLMIGSIYSVIIGPTTISNGNLPLTIDTFSILYFIIGSFIIVILEIFKKILQNN